MSSHSSTSAASAASAASATSATSATSTLRAVLGSDYSEAAGTLTTWTLTTIKEVAGGLGVVPEGDERVRGVWVDALLGAHSDDAPNSIPNSNQPTEPTPSCVAIQEPEPEDAESEESEDTEPESESDFEHEVQEIVAHRHVDGDIEYRIRWAGFGFADDTWEPPANFLGDVARLMVEQYNAADIDDQCVVCLEPIGADDRSDPNSFTCVHSSGVCGTCVMSLGRPRSCPLCRVPLVPFESEDEDDGSEYDGSESESEYDGSEDDDVVEVTPVTFGGIEYLVNEEDGFVYTFPTEGADGVVDETQSVGTWTAAGGIVLDGDGAESEPEPEPEPTTVNIWVSNSMGRLFMFTIPTTITINTDEPAVRYHDDANEFIDTIFDELSFGGDTIRSIVSNNFNSCLWGELSDMNVGHYEYDDV